MMRALAHLAVLAVGAACHTPAARERLGGLWSDDLVRAARYLPAGFDACRITTATLLEYTEELSEARMLSLTAARWSALDKYERLMITCVGPGARLPLDHQDRLERGFLRQGFEKVGRVGEVDMFRVTGVSGRLFTYQAETDGLSLAANDLDILRDALIGQGSLDDILTCCPFPPLSRGAELLQVVRFDRNGIRALATLGERERPEEIRVVIDADDLTAARQHLLTHSWSDDLRQHARATADGVTVVVPRRTSMEDTLRWASRVQDLSGILFFDDL